MAECSDLLDLRMNSFKPSLCFSDQITLQLTLILYCRTGFTQCTISIQEHFVEVKGMQAKANCCRKVAVGRQGNRHTFLYSSTALSAEPGLPR